MEIIAAERSKKSKIKKSNIDGKIKQDKSLIAHNHRTNGNINAAEKKKIENFFQSYLADYNNIGNCSVTPVTLLVC